MDLVADWALVLDFLKYAGFGLSAVAAIWGLVSQTTYEDQNKRKRLTGAGRMAIVLVIGSALVSASAFAIEGFQSFTKAQNDRDAQAKRDRRALRQELLVRAEAADRRADAAEQRERDQLLAQSVAAGTAVNLAKLQTLLQQAERGLNPITPITVDGMVIAKVTDFNSPGMHALRELVADWNREGHPPGTYGVSYFSRDIGERQSIPAGVRVGPEWLRYPRDGDEILRLMQLSTLRVKIVAPTISAADADKLVDSYYKPLGYRDTSDISFAVQSEGKFGTVVFDALEQTIEFNFTATVPEASIRRSGRIVSANDLVQFGIIVVITEEYGETPEVYDALKSARFTKLSLTVGGRVFNVDCTQFEARTTPQRQTYLFARFRPERR